MKVKEEEKEKERPLLVSLTSACWSCGKEDGSLRKQLSHLASFCGGRREHLVASTLEDADPWVLFDLGAATHCCPKNFSSQGDLCHSREKHDLCEAFQVNL